MKKHKVLLVSIKKASFVEKDLEFLNKNNFIVSTFFTGPEKGIRFIINHARLFFWLLANIRSSESIIIWFVDYHALLPALFGKIFNKKVIEIVGGFDAVSIPVIEFGIFYKNNLRAKIARESYKMADYILPVHESLIRDINYYADPSGNGYPIGIKNNVKNLKAQFEVLPTVYNSDFWKPVEDVVKGRSIITIASAGDMRTAKRKGLDLMFEIAKAMTDIPFTVIGLNEELYKILRPQAPENVKIIKYLPQQEMPSELTRHKVYYQLSLSEGLPNGLCEGMLCECIPVGSTANGIPYAIGSTGYILEEKNKDKAVKLLREALDSEMEYGKKARERILKLFPSEAREKKFIRILQEEMSK